MELTFYIFGAISILSTFLIIFSFDVMYSLLYFLISILSTSGIFFSLGAYFPGVIEIVIYIGAIMVLFVFSFMTLNLKKKSENGKSKCIFLINWKIFSLVLIILFSSIIYGLLLLNNREIIFISESDNIRRFGNKLLSSYAILVEFISMILLSGIVIAFHIGKKNK
ncbi:NADH-quinone oxidoreductase subunit J [Buchnera aphidicola (Tetraneura ulmi)]|uniref:NADH-quinone oxidoreductase subunit J family protein n=1 Tax=Buchnera aphidicola TaxID=9 RepID=UPI003463EBFD